MMSSVFPFGFFYSASFLTHFMSFWTQSENGPESCTLAFWRLLWKCLNWLQGSLFISCVFPLVVDKLPQPGFSSAVFFFKDPDGTVRPACPRPESIHLNSANIQSSNMFLLDVSLTGKTEECISVDMLWWVTFIMCVFVLLYTKNHTTPFLSQKEYPYKWWAKLGLLFGQKLKKINNNII